MKSVPSVYGESIWLKKNEKPVFALNVFANANWHFGFNHRIRAFGRYFFKSCCVLQKNETRFHYSLCRYKKNRDIKARFDLKKFPFQ